MSYMRLQRRVVVLMDCTRVLHSLHDRLANLEAKANGEAKPESSTENITVSTGFVESLPLGQSPPAFNVGPFLSPSQQCSTDSILVPERILPHPSTSLSTTYASEDTSPKISSLPSGQDLGDISAMGMALSKTEASTHIPREFYGEPSAASLLHDMLHRDRRPSAPGDSKQDSALHPSSPSTRRSFSLSCSSNTDEYHLPPRHVADNLLCIYRERVQTIYPFLHWQTLMEAYNRLWLSDSEIKNMPRLTGAGLGGSQCPVPVFYCALNAIFALATQFTDGSAHDRKERTAPFLRRSKHLMHLDFLDNANISLIQALLIFARYLQSTNLPSRCWNVAGMAYRMAQSLGLHLAMNETGTSELEREVRRRVWHSCVSLDTYENPSSCILLPILLTSLFFAVSWACLPVDRSHTQWHRRFPSPPYQTRSSLHRILLAVMVIRTTFRQQPSSQNPSNSAIFSVRFSVIYMTLGKSLKSRRELASMSVNAIGSMFLVLWRLTMS